MKLLYKNHTTGLFILPCNLAFFKQIRRINRVRTSLFQGQSASKFSPKFKDTQASFPLLISTFNGQFVDTNEPHGQAWVM